MQLALVLLSLLAAPQIFVHGEEKPAVTVPKESEGANKARTDPLAKQQKSLSVVGSALKEAFAGVMSVVNETGEDTAVANADWKATGAEADSAHDTVSVHHALGAGTQEAHAAAQAHDDHHALTNIARTAIAAAHAHNDHHAGGGAERAHDVARGPSAEGQAHGEQHPGGNAGAARTHVQQHARTAPARVSAHRLAGDYHVAINADSVSQTAAQAPPHDGHHALAGPDAAHALITAPAAAAHPVLDASHVEDAA